MQAQIILERTTLGREIAEKDRLEAERQLVEAQASIKISKRLNSEGPKFVSELPVLRTIAEP